MTILLFVHSLIYNVNVRPFMCKEIIAGFFISLLSDVLPVYPKKIFSAYLQLFDLILIFYYCTKESSMAKLQG